MKKKKQKKHHQINKHDKLDTKENNADYCGMIYKNSKKQIIKDSVNAIKDKKKNNDSAINYKVFSSKKDSEDLSTCDDLDRKIYVNILSDQKNPS